MSGLRTGLCDYLALRRSLGYKLERSGSELEHFVTYSEEAGSTHVTTEVALSWALRAANHESSWRADRLAMVRRFARYLHAVDPAHEIPPAGLIPGRRRRPEPFLYSGGEVLSLMEASRRLRSPIQAATVETIVGLLWSTGLRVAEAIRLDDADLDADDRTLLVGDSKGGRSRWVPLDDSVVAALIAYMARRDEVFPRRRAPSLFVSTVGHRLDGGNLGVAFRAALAMTDIGTTATGRLPRLADLRHSFAVTTLVGWHAEHRDVRALLPVLSTYLGHVSPASTYWYLSASPGLLAAAAGRLGVEMDDPR
ncbi:MAG: tyrosine-type recombinase/integrase [Actinomycetota bacterium]|nr:tyrosine-type recombinase/integrase [Actinomycetota bacterium]MDA8359681.1 tyrosine-type recombinase/integrase [Actinomycetota bacterium]